MTAQEGTEKEAFKAELLEMSRNYPMWCWGRSQGRFGAKNSLFKGEECKACSGTEISLWLKYRQFRSVYGEMGWER